MICEGRGRRARAVNILIDTGRAVGLTDNEIGDAAQGTIGSGLRNGRLVGMSTAEEITARHLSSVGEEHRGQLRFAERFTRAHGGRLVFVHGIGWHIWDGARWAQCLDGEEHRAVVELIKTALSEIAQARARTNARCCSRTSGRSSRPPASTARSSSPAPCTRAPWPPPSSTPARTC